MTSSEVVSYPTSVKITEVQITKERANSKIGTHLKKTAREAGIGLSGLTENSPLRGTAIRSKGGQVLLAVNGDPNLRDVAAAATLLGSRQKVSLLVCEQHQNYNTTASCIQIVAAPFFKHNPGVNFSSTRGRTLVTISKIFKNGPFAGNTYIHKGDIVLAVNGIPVSKPEEADRALRQPPADGSVTVLHLVDIPYFRALIIGSVDSKVAFKADKHDPQKQYMMAQRAGASTTPLPIHYDPETQHMVDPTPYKKMAAQHNEMRDSVSSHFKTKTSFPSWYQRVIAFMDKFNERVDAALDPLEDLACEYAWRHDNAPPPPQMIRSPSSPRAEPSAGSPGFVRPTVMLENSQVYVPNPRSPRAYSTTADFISC